MTPAGSYFVVSVQGQYTGYTPGVAVTMSSVNAAVTTALQAAGFRPIFSALSDPELVPSQVFSFPVTGSVGVRTTFDYAQDQDAIYQIGQAIQVACGTVPNLQVTDQGSPTDPDPVQPAVQVPNIPGSGILDGLQKWLASLETDVKYLVIGAGVLVVVLIVAAGWSPNAPKLATIKL